MYSRCLKSCTLISLHASLIIQIPYADWWEMVTTHECPQAPEAIFIHPGATQAALAGNATIALEIVDEMPDVDCIVVPYGSGSVCTGIACSIRQLAKEQRHKNVSLH